MVSFRVSSLADRGVGRARKCHHYWKPLCPRMAIRDRLRLFRWTSGSLALPREIFEEENV